MTDQRDETSPDSTPIDEEVRRYYRDAVVNRDRRVPSGDDRWGTARYDAATLDGIDQTTAGLSMGCGNPYALADLKPGETVLDLGSGAGLDVILSARRVGPEGRAYGVDFLDEMLDRARANAAEAGVPNAEFLRGRIEDVPLPDASVDVVISNCVINLSSDKAAVLAEIARVLRPGGRVAISDVVAENDYESPADAEQWADCGAGALGRAEYLRLLGRAGLIEATIEYTHQTGPGLHAAAIRAVRPVAGD